MTTLTIVIPTFNEQGNVTPLIDAISSALSNLDWEMIFVDDNSPDGTADAVRKIAQKNRRVRVIQRMGRRGLSSACIEGILASSSPYIAVMDADLQHDESILPAMLSAIQKDDLDLVIGSRFVQGGSTGTMPADRVKKSLFATLLTNKILKTPLLDPMSGFFLLKRSFFMGVLPSISGKGFKILLDIFTASKNKVKFVEIPYNMRARKFGETKLDTLVVWEFLVLLADKFFGPLLPVKFMIFIGVGFTGIFVHLTILGLMHKALGLAFIFSHIIATIIAMTSNFIINNSFTYRDQMLKGVDFIKGLISFYLACSIGAVINVLVARLLFDFNISWWMAGVVGAVLGSVWNYTMTSVFTWKKGG